MNLVPVRAIAVGYDGTDLREVGEIFGMPEGVTGKWFEPVGDKPAEKDDKPAKHKGKPGEALA